MPVFNNILAGASGSTGGAAGGFKIERSLRFNSNDTAYLSRTPSSAGNLTTWTWSGWVKRTKLGTEDGLFVCSDPNANSEYATLYFNSANELKTTAFAGTSIEWRLTTNRVFRDPSAWMHIVLAVDTTASTPGDRVKLYVNGVRETSFRQETYPSPSFQGRVNKQEAHAIGSAAPYNTWYGDFYLAEVHFLDGLTATTSTDNANGSVTGTPNAEYLTDFGEFDSTTGVWNPKEFSGSHGTNGFHLDFKDNSSLTSLGFDAAGSNDWAPANLQTDTTGASAATNYDSNWTVTTDNSGVGTASINGNVASAVNSKWSAASSANALTANQVNRASFTGGGGNTFYGLGKKLTTNYNATIRDSTQSYGLYIAWNGTNTNNNGTGTTISPTSFGTSDVITFVVDPINSKIYVYKNGILSTSNTLDSNFVSAINNGDIYWQSDQYSSGSVTLTNGESPDTTDSFLDSPSNYEASSGNNGGNYATLNPLANSKFQSRVLSNGNLNFTGNTNASSGYPSAFSTIGMTSGKFYCECTVHNSTDTNGVYVGVCDKRMTTPEVSVANTYPGGPGGNAYSSHGRMEQNNSIISTGNGNYTGGDVIGIAYDADNGKLYFSKNGQFVNSANPAGGTNPNLSNIAGEQFFVFGGYQNRGLIVNFGQRPFNTTPPAGFKSLCTTNLDDPLIAKGSNHFDIQLYEGNGASNPGGSGSTQDFSNFNFAPSFIWIKDRTQDGHDHNLVDIVRAAPNLLFANALNAEVTDSTDGFTNFTSDGFTLGDNGQGTQSLELNKNGNDYVAWAWAGGHGGNTSISAGAQNSSAYDSRTLWRNALSGTIESGQSAATVFNNSNGGTHAASGNTLTFTTPSGYALSGTLEVHMARGTGASAAYGDYDVKVNGTSVFNHSTFPYNTNAIVNLGTFDNITSIEWGYGGNSSNDWIQFNEIRVNGKELVDSDVTPANIPSIASVGRADTNAGFSIMTYEGNGNANQTVAHNLGAAPAFVIIKDRTSSQNWAVMHTGAPVVGMLDGGPEYQMLELSSAAGASNFSYDTIWHPTSTTVKITEGANSAHWVNKDEDDYVMYSWAPVSGYSSFGSYTGTGDATNGAFVYTGFRPRFVMIKNTSSSQSTGGMWVMIDTSRNPGNNCDDYLQADVADNEGVTSVMDVLSNGFRCTNAFTSTNGTGIHYVYAAWAENPFKYSRAR